jgi:hypothetical protein
VTPPPLCLSSSISAGSRRTSACAVARTSS